jgi:energy-converting hydrogenase Eha subunit B
MKREAEEDWGRAQKRSPVAGAEQEIVVIEYFISNIYSDGRSSSAATAFAASLLFTFGNETGLLNGLPLPLGGLLAATALLLATLAALLVLLLTLVRHRLLLGLPQGQTRVSGSGR